MTHRGPHAAHGPGDPHPDALPEELAGLLAEIVPPGGTFRHREHIHLAYLAVPPHGTDFASFAERYPGLLDKRLLTRHYTARTLASPAARTGWVDPDLVPFPWRS